MQVNPISTSDAVLASDAHVQTDVARFEASRGVLSWGPFRVDLLAQRAWVDGQEVVLEPIQLRVLGCLIERAGLVWTQEDLHARLYGGASVNERAVARAVSGLRRRCGSASELIVCLRGVGYGLGVAPRGRS